MTPISTRTRVVFLQHPRERRVAIGTCRMAHLALPNSELHLGVHFDDHARLNALLADPDAGLAVLYPGEGSVLPDRVETKPKTLLVVDGTWTQAKKVLARNPALLALPRIGLKPAKPGNYRIRPEPSEECLSTIEAVVEVLGHLEGTGEAPFRPMLRAFERMVDRQIERTAARTGPPRRRRLRERVRRVWTPPSLMASPERIVLVHAEANAPGHDSGERFDPELVHLVALRPATGERFEALLAPRQRLAEHTPAHLGVTTEALLAGETVPDFLTRWRAFLRAGDVLGVWGGFALSMLENLGEPEWAHLNLRFSAARKLNVKVGGVQAAGERMGPFAPRVWAQGRGGRRLASMEQVLAGLLQSDVGAMRAREVSFDGRG